MVINLLLDNFRQRCFQDTLGGRSSNRQLEIGVWHSRERWRGIDIHLVIHTK